MCYAKFKLSALPVRCFESLGEERSTDTIHEALKEGRRGYPRRYPGASGRRRAVGAGKELSEFGEVLTGVGEVHDPDRLGEVLGGEPSDPGHTTPQDADPRGEPDAEVLGGRDGADVGGRFPSA